MGATAAITAVTAFVKGPKKAEQGLARSAGGLAGPYAFLKGSGALDTPTPTIAPPVSPAIPDAAKANQAAADAMSAAAARVRRQQGSGFGSTILTSPNGTAGQAPVARKNLLGL